MTVRDISSVTLCLAIVVCLSLTSVASEAYLEDDVNSGWGDATLIETDNSAGADRPQISVDGPGNATAVWVKYDGYRHNIWANRYNVGTGWETETQVQTDESGDAGHPRVAIDGSGNVTAVWARWNGTCSNIWATRCVVGTGWEMETLIQTDSLGEAQLPQVGVDISGNALAVWHQYDGARYNIWANRYVVGAGWGTAALIETNNSGGASDPQIAVDAAGNATAVWRLYDGIRSSIWANRYVVGTGWETETLIQTSDSGTASNPQIAVDATGNATAVWRLYDGIRFNILSNRYVIGIGWGTATLIETGISEESRSPQIAVDATGNATAVWGRSDGTRMDIWSNRYVVETGWETATLIETGDSESAYEPQVAVDGSGDATAVWYQYDGTRHNIWSNRYVVGVGWETAMLIETNNSGDAYYPQVGVDDSGNATVVWVQYDGIQWSIWSNRYIESDTPTTTLLSPTAILAVSAVLVVVISVILIRRRRKTADRNNKSIEEEEPPHS